MFMWLTIGSIVPLSASSTTKHAYHSSSLQPGQFSFLVVTHVPHEFFMIYLVTFALVFTVWGLWHYIFAYIGKLDLAFNFDSV